MADLNDRGQIILVAAFALGVIFIALAVVVNAAIFTENLATRGKATSDDDALYYRYELERGGGDVVEFINENYTGSGPGALSDLEARARGNVTNISRQANQQNVINGRVVNVDLDSIDTGTRFVNTTNDYTNVTGTTTYIIAENVDRTRAFDLNVSGTGELANSESNAFTISARDGLTTWNMSVYEDTPGSANVTVTNSAGDEATCTRSVSGEFTIQLTAGTFEGEPCHALRVSDDDVMWYTSGFSSDYDIWFDNADNITGAYQGIIDGGSMNLSFSGQTHTAIYNMTLDYRYETSSLVYETDIRVAPEEPDP